MENKEKEGGGGGLMRKLAGRGRGGWYTTGGEKLKLCLYKFFLKLCQTVRLYIYCT